jgi:hypothetical protein
MIKFDRYALISVAHAWRGGRNPVRYVRDVEQHLDLKLDELRWHDVARPLPPAANAT